jgi:hypothetical protein
MKRGLFSLMRNKSKQVRMALPSPAMESDTSRTDFASVLRVNPQPDERRNAHGLSEQHSSVKCSLPFLCWVGNKDGLED